MGEYVQTLPPEYVVETLLYKQPNASGYYAMQTNVRSRRTGEVLHIQHQFNHEPTPVEQRFVLAGQLEKVAERLSKTITDPRATNG